jgi:hypothetical protein
MFKRNGPLSQGPFLPSDRKGWERLQQVRSEQ